ncbi:MAG: hypothetical protein M0030_29140 [Actinomycetota bacterium]|nr:hypothetical protein [Actinomycetota bacterium]
MITRRHFALPYTGYDATLPPPLGFMTAPRNSHVPRRMIRGGGMSVHLATPRLMADPSNPATWQRPYIFPR